jgi:glycyl-tRNA synthetase beta chain
MANTADLLFELGTEELPPVALRKLSNALTNEFVAGLAAANLAHGEVKSYAAPRRLAIFIKDVEVQQADRDVERRGPAVKAAFDADGNPTKAAEGFAQSCGTTVDQLQRIETPKGEWLAYQMHEAGQAASELLPTIAENALNKLPIPKRMRWGSSEAQFVRPVHWLVFLLGNDVVNCRILDATSGRISYGHRFHHPEAIEIKSPDTYADQLLSPGYVIADFDQRKAKVKAQVEETAASLNGVAEMDDDLLEEVTALNEWPIPVAGDFEERFLEVPHEALVSTMKSNQKYFPIFNAKNELMNHFITLANIESKDPAMIKAGNERVVRPRLADAMFFWQQDGKKKLEDHIERLKTVVFQKQLGSMYDKSERVAALAEYIAKSIDGDVAKAKRAGQLSRCDLMTEMVYEFGDMQGIMGRYQAQRDGEDAEIAQAMDEFYMPRFSGDQLPQTKTGIAIALAERIDTLVGIFGIGMKPTGDKDPFALRRAALGALRIIREHQLPLNIRDLLTQASNNLAGNITEASAIDDVEGFMFDRLKGLYADLGVSVDTFEAVLAVKPATLNDFDQRINAVTDFRGLPEAEALAAANKRISNLLKKVEGELSSSIDTKLFDVDAESALHQAMQDATSSATRAMASSAYSDALKALSTLRSPVDAYFDDVMVMADDAAVKANRLAMLGQLQSAFLQVADIGLLQPQQ